MVKLLFSYLLLGMITLHNEVIASENFNVRLSKTEVEYGKYISLVVSSSKTAPSLDSIDLSGLENQFHISELTGVVIDDDQQKWRLRLYPRSIGNLTIPALSYDGMQSPETNIHVTPPVHEQSNQVFHLEFSPAVKGGWIHQEFITEFSIFSNDENLVIETSQTPQRNGELYVLPIDKRAVGSEPFTRYTIKLLYYPGIPGNHSIELPSVQIKTGGKSTHRFYFPVQQVSAKPLPFYIPPNMLVGHLSLEAEPLPWLFLTNTLAYMKLHLTTQGIQEELRPNIENYLHGQEYLQFYTASSIKSLVDLNGEHAVKSLHTIPFKVTSSGIYQPGTIVINYFDPKSGTMRKLLHEWTRIVAVNVWQVTIVLLLLLAAIVYMLMQLYKRLFLIVDRINNLRRIKSELQSVKNIEALKKTLIMLAMLEKSSDAVSLKEWHMENSLDYNLLSRALYREHPRDMSALANYYLQYFRTSYRYIP